MKKEKINEEKEDLNKTNEKKVEDEKPQKEQEKIIEKIIERNLDYKDKYLRMLADQENIRKRMQKEKEEVVRFAIENTIEEFLPVMDNFEQALKFAEASSEEVKNWAMGFKMILSQFRDVLHSHNIVAFHSEGNMFDPHFHEAMEIVETTEQPDGMILEEYAKGYKSPNRVIRPARVKVAKAPFKDEEKIKEEEKN